MNNLILDGFASDKLVLAMSNPQLEMLVREVNHKYKLLAYSITSRDDDKVVGGGKVHMCDADGLPVCSLYVTAENEPKFHYYSPWYEKDRGSSNEDRHTIHSKKLSALMATLKRHNVVPDKDKLLDQIVARPIVYTVYDQIRWAYRYDDPRPLDAQVGRVLLKIMFSEESDSAYSQLDRTYCRGLLDKYNEVDKIIQTVKNMQQSIMHKPFYAIGVNTGSSYLIGKAKVEVNNTGVRSLVVIEPFKRIKSLMDVEELRGILTMLKISHDKLADNGRRMLGGDFKIPYTDYFDTDMEVVYGYNGVDRYNRQWMVIPCSAV